MKLVWVLVCVGVGGRRAAADYKLSNWTGGNDLDSIKIVGDPLGTAKCLRTV